MLNVSQPVYTDHLSTQIYAMRALRLSMAVKGE